MDYTKRCFKDMRRNLRKYLYFKQGLSEFKSDFSDTDPFYNNILVLDDTMDMAMDSPFIS